MATHVLRDLDFYPVFQSGLDPGEGPVDNVLHVAFQTCLRRNSLC